MTTICTTLERTIPVNGESKQWHEEPAIVKPNLNSIVVFVKHPPGNIEPYLERRPDPSDSRGPSELVIPPITSWVGREELELVAPSGVGDERGVARGAGGWK